MAYAPKSRAPKTKGSKASGRQTANPAGKSSCPGGVKTDANAPPKRVVREQ